MNAPERFIRGDGGGGKGGGGSARTPVEATDSLHSKQYARVLDLVSEGEIVGLVNGLKSVYLDGTPLQNDDNSFNFQDVSVVERTGTQVQTYIPGFSAIESETSVAAEVKNSASVTRSVTDANINAVRVTLGIPRLTYQDPSNGDLSGAKVEIAIDLQTAGGGFVAQPIGRVDDPTKFSIVAGPIGRMAVASTKTVVNVTWTPAGVSSGTSSVLSVQSGTTQTVSFNIQYRAASSGGSWTTIKSASMSATPVGTNGVNEWGEFDGNVYYAFAAKDISASHALTFASGTWEFRTVVTGGTGAVAVTSGIVTVTTYTDIISGKTTSNYQRAYRIPVTGAGPWDVRVRRITADSTSSALSNQTWWSSYTEIVDTLCTYPNSAIEAIQIDAKQFQNIPTRGYEIKGLKISIPKNYDPILRTYATTGPGTSGGVWDGTFVTAWTNNPAWIFYDLITNSRYGCGSRMGGVTPDKWALYTIGKYCDFLVPDGFGGMEPRFTCNLYLQTREEAYKVITNLASVFRAVTYWAAGSVAVTQDSPGDPAALFTPANVVDGVFEYSGSSMKARHTVALVGWNDPADQYRQKVEYIEDAAGILKFGVIQTAVTAFGCTSRGQAHRYGKTILTCERLETEIVTFKTGLNAAAITPGKIIQTMDPTRSGVRFGGRILAATTSSVQIDNSVTLISGKTYTLSVILADGSVASSPVTTGAGTVSTLTVSPAFASAPQYLAMWVLAANDLAPESWRVVSMAEADKAQVQISAMTYNAGRYDEVELGLFLEPPPTSYLDLTAPAAPTGLVVTEALYIAAIKSIGVKALLSWDGSAARYVVKYRRTNDNWQEVTSTTNSVEVLGLYEDTYAFSVTAVSALGKTSPPTSTTYTVLGKSIPPADVTGLSGTPQANGLLMSWAPSADLDLDHYELREGVSWASSALIAGNVTDPRYLIPPTTAGSHSYLVKAVDTTGNYSLNAGAATVVVTAPGTVIPSATFTGDQVVLTWPVPASQFNIAGFEVRYGGASWAAATSMGSVTATRFMAKAQWLGNQRFWVAATDAGNNVGTAGFVDMVLTAPSVTMQTPQVIDNTVLLYWTGVQGSLPIDTYEIRKGSTWAGAQPIGAKSGGFTSVFEVVAGTYTYWVAPIDMAGNVGTPSSVTTAVSQPPDYQLKADYFSIFNGTLSNAVLQSNFRLLLPVNTAETFAQHFSNHSWASPQDQINAGYPIYIQPAMSSGYYEEQIDYGQNLAACHVQVNVSGSAIAGTPGVTVTISTAPDAGGVPGTWSTVTGTSTFAAGFRFVKFRVTVTSGGADLYEITNIETRLDAKLQNDGGDVTLDAAALGTVVNFNKAFLSAYTPTGTYNGSTPVTVVCDWHGALDSITYAVASNVCTVTHTAHPWVAGQNVSLNLSSGDGISGVYTITGTTANTYTVAMTTANTSGAGQSYPESTRVYAFNSTSGARVTSGTAGWSVKGY